MKLGYLIYTFNRVEDAKIQMEIVRSLWEPEFGEPIQIVHAFNGELSWYKDIYLENELIRLTNPGHFEGASNLIDAGIAALLEKEVDYIIVSAADTWLVQPEIIKKKILQMQQEDKVILGNAWGTPTRQTLRDVGMSADFFIVNKEWIHQNHMFPVSYSDFYDKHIDLLRYSGSANVSYEKLLFSKYIAACTNALGKGNNNKLPHYILDKFFTLEERNPIHTDEVWNRQDNWPEIGMYTSHEATAKQKVLKALNLDLGEASAKLLNSSDLQYYIL